MEKASTKDKTREFIEKIMNIIFLVCGLIAIIAVGVITVYIVISGVPGIKNIGFTNFFFGTEWKPTGSNPQFGILPFMLATLYGTTGAIVIGVPLGILGALFLSKVAPKPLATIVRPIIELLAGIPSVVYGLIGMMVLVPWVMNTFNLAKGESLFASIIVLAVMILPSIITISEGALNAVPKSYEEASLALGATQMETYFKVSLPAAKSGIATGVVLGIGRAVGEGMAVIMVAGNVANMPGIFKSVTFLTTSIVKEMGYAAGTQREALFSIALVLFCFIMIINAVLGLILKKKGD